MCDTADASKLVCRYISFQMLSGYKSFYSKNQLALFSERRWTYISDFHYISQWHSMMSSVTEKHLRVSYILSVSYVSRKISLISQYWTILHLLTLCVASIASRVQKCEFDSPWFFMFYILFLKEVSLLHTCMLYPNVDFGGIWGCSNILNSWKHSSDSVRLLYVIHMIHLSLIDATKVFKCILVTKHYRNQLALFSERKGTCISDFRYISQSH